MNKPAPPSRTGLKNVNVVKAHRSYQAQTAEELSFEEGDTILVLQMTDQFWKCRIGQKEGNIPASLLSQEATVENALHDACKRGNIGLIIELLDQGASVNGLDKVGNTPLHWAARSRHVEAVEILLKKVPLINAQNKMGDTPLHSACWGGSLDIVKMMVGVSGIRLELRNKSNQVPLDLAKNDEIAAFLIQYTGKRTNVQDLAGDDD